MKRVRYIDTFCYRSMHEQFNMSLLLMLGFSYDQIECRAGKFFISKVKSRFSNKNIKPVECTSVFIMPGNSRLALLLRYLISVVNSCRFLIFTPSDRVIVFNYNNLFAVRILNLLNKICHKKVVIFCHGEMELLLPVPVEAGWLHKVLSYLGSNFFLNAKIRIAKGLYFAVLGTIVKENLSTLLPANKTEHIIAVDHAYLFDNNIPDRCKPLKTELRCGCVGVFNKVKGGDQFLELARKLELNRRQDIRFSITGVITYNTDILEEAGIDLPENKGHAPLTREEFNQRIDELDFLLFLYPRLSYKMTASGAILDAINRGKPIIAIRNDYFEYLFRKYGSFGFLVDNMEEMADLLNHLAVDKNLYPDIDFEKFRKRLSPEYVKDELMDSFSDIGYL